MVEVLESLLRPLTEYFVNLVDLILNIPYLLLSVLRILLHFFTYITSFAGNVVNSINFVILSFDTVLTILNYMPQPIVTLVMMGLSVCSVRLVLDLF